ncbi:MAG: SPOR domain-containing protein [Candidatus Entotheonellia bacterium]
MLFDRFSFREREGAISEEEPIGEMPSEGQDYSFTLGARQLVLLIAGYCLLCVLVFALGVVVGRATSRPDPASEAKDLRTNAPREQGATTVPSVAFGPQAPREAEPRSQLPRESGPSVTSTFPETSSSGRGMDGQTSSRSIKPPSMPEAPRSPELSAVPSRPEGERKPEPRRAELSEAKPIESSAPRPASVQAGDYAIQVSSFRSLDQASELKGRLSKKGYGAYVQSVDLSDKGMWHRVRIGNFRDKEGAERVASELRTRENLPAQVMRR